MTCIACVDRDRKCLNCYDLECGITSLQKSIAYLELKLSKQKNKLRELVIREKPNRVQLLNDQL